MNVNIENLNMNVSMQHRTVINLVEDRKSTSEQFFTNFILIVIWCLCLDKELID
jgi:hypothetical protein